MGGVVRALGAAEPGLAGGAGAFRAVGAAPPVGALAALVDWPIQ